MVMGERERELMGRQGGGWFAINRTIGDDDNRFFDEFLGNLQRGKCEAEGNTELEMLMSMNWCPNHKGFIDSIRNGDLHTARTIDRCCCGGCHCVHENPICFVLPYRVHAIDDVRAATTTIGFKQKLDVLSVKRLIIGFFPFVSNQFIVSARHSAGQNRSDTI